MVIFVSVCLFVLVSSVLYLFGMKFWVAPQSAVDRVVGGEPTGQEPIAYSSLAFHELLARVGNLVPASPADLNFTQKRLYAAGFRSPTAYRTFYGIKGLATVILPLLAWILTIQLGVGGQTRLGLIMMAAGLGFLGAGEVLHILVKRRRKKIQRALPNSLDLLVVCVESGLGLDQAILQVSRELQHSYPELSGELAITNLEMRHGKRRSEALRNLGDRCGVDDMKKLVATLLQADRFGTSIAQTLRTQAEFMRLTSRQRAEEKAAKIGIKLVFPIFFCILPSLFVVTVGPVLVRIIFDLLPMMNGA